MHIRFCFTLCVKGVSDLALLQHVMTTIAWTMRCTTPKFETREYPGDCGVSFRVYGTNLESRKLLETFFLRVPCAKYLDFRDWSRVCFLHKSKLHKSASGTKKIIALKATMNTGRKDFSFPKLYWLNAD